LLWKKITGGQKKGPGRLGEGQSREEKAMCSSKKNCVGANQGDRSVPGRAKAERGRGNDTQTAMGVGLGSWAVLVDMDDRTNLKPLRTGKRSASRWTKNNEWE